MHKQPRTHLIVADEPVSTNTAVISYPMAPKPPRVVSDPYALCRKSHGRKRGWEPDTAPSRVEREAA